MGSFNTTCFVSQQTISSDDEVVILPISQATSYNPVDLIVKLPNGTIREESKYGISHSTCYSNAFWEHAGPLIQGTYEDCGKFIFSETKENSLNMLNFLLEFERSVCDVKAGGNASRERPTVFSKIFDSKEKHTFESVNEAMDNLFDLSQESRLFVLGLNGAVSSMGFAVMHKEAAEYLIQSVEASKRRDGNSLVQKEMYNNYFNKAYKRGVALFGEKKSKKELYQFITRDITSLRDLNIGLSSSSTLGLNYYHLQSEKIIEEMCEVMMEQPSGKRFEREITDAFAEHFKPMLNHLYIIKGLDELNLKITPMVYCDQDYSNENGNSYLNMVQAVNAKINRAIKIRHGDEDEDIADEPVSVKPKIR